MEVMLQNSKHSTSSRKKKNVLPLNQLLETTRRASSVPNHLFETRVYTKLKNNNVVEAEPSEIHFNGFEVGKDYKKFVKLINISSEVINIHILPTQTKFFRTEYIKKSRMVPGLSYTVTVHFSPNEWRYFFDSIQVHCKGEEKLLIPVHAYPIIEDLHIPSHISLPAVALGQSMSHEIPLSCSCPIDFEFQVHCLKPHEAFIIQPLSGVIPANGKTDFTVTFTPHQYGTAEITLQLVISQFNSKPFICTLTASCLPHLTLKQSEKYEESEDVFVKGQNTDVRVTLPAAFRLKQNNKNKDDQYLQSPVLNVSSHAGFAKMLIQHQDNISYKDLHETMSQTKMEHQMRQTRAASFENQVRVNAQKEKAKHLRWQVNLGDELTSTEQKMKILKKQEFEAVEYKTKKNTSCREMNFAGTLPKLSSQRVQRNAGQLPDCIPAFCVYGNSSLEVRQRMLRLFQQAVRKVILQRRMKNRLSLLQKLASEMKRQVRGEIDRGVSEKPLLMMSSEMLVPFTLPIFGPENQPDELAVDQLGYVHVRPFRASLTTCIPFFILKVPQNYKLKGYQKMSAYDTGSSFVSSELRRPLRTGAQDELLSAVMCHTPEFLADNELQDWCKSKQAQETTLSFSAPKNLMNPLNAHPLRIFNPAPGVQAFKPTPYYLESDLEYHLCPLPKHRVSKDNTIGICAPSLQKKFLDRKGIIKGIMQWKKFPSPALTNFPYTLSITSSNQTPFMSDPFNNSLIPMEGPPVLHKLPDSIEDEISSGMTEYSGVRISPEMVLAEFASSEKSSSKLHKVDSAKDDRETQEQLLESMSKSQNNKLASKVLSRMKCLSSMRCNNSDY
ncbi:cilia- and flagella-associated protein 221 [Hoplias malabaricus]|uniref:cilia- and flagella-associated protein 221 n=1 Tax=Hoplias malabaricus TaxID=27720 RepID=UPI0034631FBA